MRVNYTGGWKSSDYESSMEDFVRRQLEYTEHFGYDTKRGIEDNLENTQEFIGKLVILLIENKILNFDQLKEMLGYYGKLEEVE